MQGTALVESSIQEAYLTLIRDAEHCIHIENQFFISSVATQDGTVKNTVAQVWVGSGTMCGTSHHTGTMCWHIAPHRHHVLAHRLMRPCRRPSSIRL